jgi:CheY-like chemotaxis protein
VPARVVVVHDEPIFSKRTVDALRLAGYEVAAFTDPMAALDALEKAFSTRKTKRNRPGSDGSA